MKLFYSSKRGKVAIVLIVVGILGIFSDPFSGLCCIVFGLLLFIPEFIYLASSSDSLWGKWGNPLDSNAQKTRIQRAMSGELTPLNVDLKSRCATFVGSDSKKYRTTLKNCTCPDFKKRGVPCKHMFYLANELGLLKFDDAFLDEM